ncbi:MAG: MFS transporter [Planctomycetota bacterium]|jgi:MFS family permease
MTSNATPSPRSVLGLVFLTVFIDLVGFSILFPLFPALLEHYVELEGPESAVGRLQSALAGLVEGRANPELAVVALFGGFLGSIYSILQFLMAPFWGGLSDRIGRRRTLMFTLGGTAFGYALWFVSGSFWVLILSRLINGMMAGNIAVATAVVADVSEPEKRTRNMAVVGIAVGLGFVLGPALGALAYAYAPFPEVWIGDGTLSTTDFSGAALVAFALALVNWGWAAARFPETRQATTNAPEARPRNPFASLARISNLGVRRTNLVYLLYQTCFAAMEFTLVFLAADRFGYEPRENAYMFVFIGLTIAFIQGGVVRRLSGKVDDRRIALIGIGLLVPGFAIVGATPGGSTAMLYFGLFLLATGSALGFPSLSSLVSSYAPRADQGLALGTFRSMGALSRAVGPIIGGALYWGLGSGAPYFIGAAALLVPLWLATRLPEPSPSAG